MTQAERVLKALRSYRGVSQVEFLAPNVCDNGKPITRLAARVQDLRDQGHEISIIGRRHGCVVYRLEREAPGVERDGRSPERGAAPAAVAEPAVPLSVDGQGELFGVPRRKGRHGFADQEQAA